VSVATVGGDDGGGPYGALLTDGGLLTLYNGGVTGAGENIYARSFGTSFATPIVAGTAALMLSVNPGLTVDQLVTGLTSSARPHVQSPWLAACSADNSASCLCTATTCGAGMLDAEQAVYYARDPSGYVPPARRAEVLDNAELAAASAATPQATPASAQLEADATGAGALSAWWLLCLVAAVAALTGAPRRVESPSPQAAG
jgi:serine protease